MTLDEWKTEVARIFRTYRLNEQDAAQLAEALAVDSYPDCTPQEAVDEETSCWGD